MNEIYISEEYNLEEWMRYISEWGSGRMNEIFINEEYNLEEWMRYISVNEDLPWKK